VTELSIVPISAYKVKVLEQPQWGWGQDGVRCSLRGHIEALGDHLKPSLNFLCDALNGYFR